MLNLNWLVFTSLIVMIDLSATIWSMRHVCMANMPPWQKYASRMAFWVEAKKCLKHHFCRVGIFAVWHPLISLLYILQREKRATRTSSRFRRCTLGFEKRIWTRRVKILFENPRVQRLSLVRVRVAFFEVEYYVLLFKLFSALCKLVLFRILYKSCLV